MDIFLLSNIEILIVILLTTTLILSFKLFNKNNKLTFAHPLIFYSIIMLYYTVITPVIRVITNQTLSRGLDFREQFILGWIGALLSSISVLIGYNFTSIKKKTFSVVSNLKYHSLWII